MIGHFSARTGVLGVAAVALGVALPLIGAPVAEAKTAAAWDFDGDGRRDVAVGVQGENDGAGAVLVFPGTASGVQTVGTKRFSQDTSGVPGDAEAGDRFGAALASGDFDADGYADLAVGAPDEDSAKEERTGAVTVLYGSRNGLSGKRSHFLERASSELGAKLKEETYLGSELAAADFDGDGDADLAVATRAGLGGLLIYRGGSKGLRGRPAQQVGPGLGLSDSLDSASPDGGLATGDLDGNGASDLALGLLNQNQAAGAVAVLYGAKGRGLDLTGAKAPASQVWSQDSPDAKGVAAELDAFGAAVGIGDVTGDGRKDLVISASQQPNSAGGVQGALHVLKGSSKGVTASGDQYAKYEALVGGPLGGPLGNLGEELAVGDLDGDGIADIATTRGTLANHRWGAVLVLHGSKTGLGAGRKASFTQATEAMGGGFEPVDYWGDTLRIHQVGASGPSDLLVGDPFEDVSEVVDAGSVNVLFGAPSGLSDTRSTYLTKQREGVPGSADEQDYLGSGL